MFVMVVVMVHRRQDLSVLMSVSFYSDVDVLK